MGKLSRFQPLNQNRAEPKSANRANQIKQSTRVVFAVLEILHQSEDVTRPAENVETPNLNPKKNAQKSRERTQANSVPEFVSQSPPIQEKKHSKNSANQVKRNTEISVSRKKPKRAEERSPSEDSSRSPKIRNPATHHEILDRESNRKKPRQRIQGQRRIQSEIPRKPESQIAEEGYD